MTSDVHRVGHAAGGPPDPFASALPPLGPLRRGVRETGLALITLGVIVFLFVGYQLFGTTLTEEHNQSRLKQDFQEQVTRAAASPGATTPTTSRAVASGPVGSGASTGGGADSPTLGSSGAVVDPTVPSGTAIDHLVIPAIGVDKFVVQGTAEADLSQGPGHYPSTVMPGQVGNAGIAGHRTTYGAPFFRLDELKVGDPIYITDTSGTRYTYTMTSSEVVSPGDGAVLDPTTTAQLTLTTCNPRFSDTSRLVVVADLSATQAPTTAAPTTAAPTTASPTTASPTTASPTTPSPTTTAPARAGTGHDTSTGSLAPTRQAAAGTNLGEGTHSALPPALAYGAVVVAMWVLVRLAINRTRRWRRTGVFLVGIGLCLIPLWFCFENVVRVLPSSV
jgi:sortase A